jgi:hypothetical protein
MRWKLSLIVAAVLATGPAARACNTPVYRYAMYNWPAAPYRVFYFHEARPPKEDVAVNRLLEHASRAEAPLNLSLETVDVTKKDRFAKLPEVVRKAWEERSSKAKTLHAVFNTRGQRVFVGELRLDSARAMVDSPARRRLGNLLAQGNAGVLVLLASPKADVTRKADLAIDELLRRVQAGEVAVPTTDGSTDSPATGGGVSGVAGKGVADDDQVRADPRRLKVARITISRTDPAEVWLVRTLLAVEEDLGQYVEEPMVFAVYGRARVMPPFVGKGITVDNLAEGVAFLAGACSCVIKDENPGVDLLLGWNWDTVSETLAADDPQSTSGDGLGYRESSAEAQPSRPAERQAQAAAPKPASARTHEPEKKAAGPVLGAKPAAAMTSAAATSAAATSATAASAMAAEPDATGYVRRQMRVTLLAVAVAALVVFTTAGMAWMRRNQAGNS